MYVCVLQSVGVRVVSDVVYPSPPPHPLPSPPGLSSPPAALRLVAPLSLPVGMELIAAADGQGGEEGDEVGREGKLL